MTQTALQPTLLSMKLVALFLGLQYLCHSADNICYLLCFFISSWKLSSFSQLFECNQSSEKLSWSTLTIKVNLIIIFLWDYLQKLLILTTEDIKVCFKYFFNISKVKLQGISVLRLEKWLGIIISSLKIFEDMIKYNNVILASPMKNCKVSIQINTQKGW